MLATIFTWIIIALGIAFLLVCAFLVYSVFTGGANTEKDDTPRAYIYEDAAPRQVNVNTDMGTYPGIKIKQARCVGMMHYLSDDQRRKIAYPYVEAYPEPTNEHDPNAVKIISPAGKKLGYLSAGQAKLYSEMIQEIGSLRLNYHVEGIKLWLDLPTVPELRKAIKQKGEK